MCGVVCWIMWRWTACLAWLFLIGLLLYALVGTVVWHGFMVLQKLFLSAHFTYDNNYGLFALNLKLSCGPSAAAIRPDTTMVYGWVPIMTIMESTDDGARYQTPGLSASGGGGGIIPIRDSARSSFMRTKEFSNSFAASTVLVGASGSVRIASPGWHDGELFSIFPTVQSTKSPSSVDHTAREKYPISLSFIPQATTSNFWPRNFFSGVPNEARLCGSISIAARRCWEAIWRSSASRATSASFWATAVFCSSCCSSTFASDKAVLASVSPLSNCLSCAACFSFTRFPVIKTPIPNANAKKSASTAPTSHSDFQSSTDTERPLYQIEIWALAIVGVLSFLCACVFPFVYWKYCRTKSIAGRYVYVLQ